MGERAREYKKQSQDHTECGAAELRAPYFRIIYYISSIRRVLFILKSVGTRLHTSLTLNKFLETLSLHSPPFKDLCYYIFFKEIET